MGLFQYQLKRRPLKGFKTDKPRIKKRLTDPFATLHLLKPLTSISDEGMDALAYAVFKNFGEEYRESKLWILEHYKNFPRFESDYKIAKHNFLVKKGLCKLEKKYCKNCKCAERTRLHICKSIVNKMDDMLGEIQLCEIIAGTVMRSKLDRDVCGSEYSEWHDSRGALYGGYRKCIACQVPQEYCIQDREPKLLANTKVQKCKHTATEQGNRI